jgi:biotin transport system substrate-specific component
MMNTNLRLVIFIALFAALIAVGSIISIPIGPVNMVLANFFIFLAGLLLGFPWAGVSVAVYLLIGLIGLPVFQGGSGGPAHFFGPTGGFLIGYLAAAFVIPLVSGTGKRKLWKDIAALLIGLAVIYVPGLPWLKLKLGFTWEKAFAVGFAPYILVDLAKAAVAVFVAQALVRTIDWKSWLDPEEADKNSEQNDDA